MEYVVESRVAWPTNDKFYRSAVQPVDLGIHNIFVGGTNAVAETNQAVIQYIEVMDQPTKDVFRSIELLAVVCAVSAVVAAAFAIGAYTMVCDLSCRSAIDNGRTTPAGRAMSGDSSKSV